MGRRWGLGRGRRGWVSNILLDVLRRALEGAIVKREGKGRRFLARMVLN